MAGFKMQGRKPPKRQPKRSAAGRRSVRPTDQGVHVMAEERGKEGKARVRLVTRVKPNSLGRAQAQQRRVRAQQTPTPPPIPGRRGGSAKAQHRVATHEEDQEAIEAPQNPPAEAPAPQPADGGSVSEASQEASQAAVVAPQTAPSSPEPVKVPEPPQEPEVAFQPQSPIQVKSVVVDGTERPVGLDLALMGHGSVFESDGFDEHGQQLYKLRRQAEVRADREVKVVVHNSGAPMRVGLMGFHGDRLRVTELTVGSGVEATLSLMGPIHGHIELALAPS